MSKTGMKQAQLLKSKSLTICSATGFPKRSCPPSLAELLHAVLARLLQLEETGSWASSPAPQLVIRNAGSRSSMEAGLPAGRGCPLGHIEGVDGRKTCCWCRLRLHNPFPWGKWWPSKKQMLALIPRRNRRLGNVGNVEDLWVQHLVPALPGASGAPLRLQGWTPGC
jgi:hypothetical protein